MRKYSGSSRGVPVEALRRENQSFRRILVDRLSGLPTFEFLAESMTRKFRQGRLAAIFYIDCGGASEAERIYGQRVYDRYLREFARELKNTRGALLRTSDIILVLRPLSDKFLVFLSSTRYEGRVTCANLEKIKERLERALLEKVSQKNLIPAEFLKFYIGYSIIMPGENVSPFRVLERAVDEARSMAFEIEEDERLDEKEELKRIIVCEEITTAFQPIVRMQDSVIMGFEALSRGPRQSHLEYPKALFAVADRSGLFHELDRLCRSKAFLNFKLNSLLGEQEGFLKNSESEELKLFINVDPRVFLEDSTFSGSLLSLTGRYGINPGSIVLEVTERPVMEDVKNLKAKVQELRERGFLIAIDDVGAGYASLQVIAELVPDYLKFDMLLTRGIDMDRVKQGLLFSVLDIARRINAKVIVEGIERKSEYEFLLGAQVEFGQGFFFGKPRPYFVESKKLLLK